MQVEKSPPTILFRYSPDTPLKDLRDAAKDDKIIAWIHSQKFPGRVLGMAEQVKEATLPVALDLVGKL